MSAAPEDAVWTLDDLMALPDDGRRHELLWGAIVMTPVPSARHADIVDDLTGRLCRVCAPDQRVRANSGVVVPDRAGRATRASGRGAGTVATLPRPGHARSGLMNLRYS